VDERAGQYIASAALGGLGRGHRERALGVLVWADLALESTGIRMQLLDEKGALVGAPRVLSKQVGVAANAAVVAHSEGGGAVLYTVGSSPLQSQLRLLLLDEDGMPRREPIAVTYGDQNARDAAIARYATGYAVVYRSVPADPSASASVRIAVLDARGALAGTREIATAGRNVSQIRSVQANDGRLFIAWADEDDTSVHTTLHMVRALCQ
jgi:hypothetical protein